MLNLPERTPLQRHRDTFGVDCQLTDQASQIYRLIHSQREVWDHIDDFGSGHDCYGLVTRRDERELYALLVSLNTTPQEFFEALEMRTDYKFAYFHFHDILNLFDVKPNRKSGHHPDCNCDQCFYPADVYAALHDSIEY